MVEKHKTEWRVIVVRATGILVLLSEILLAAGLCDATTPADNSVSSIFDPRSTPAESIATLATRRDSQKVGLSERAIKPPLLATYSLAVLAMVCRSRSDSGGKLSTE